MRYSRLATNDEGLDEYTPLMHTDQSGGTSNSSSSLQQQQLNTADHAYLLPIVNPSVQTSLNDSSTRFSFIDMLQ